MVTKDLRFAMDEKGMKTLAETLPGRPMSYWDNDRQLKHGVVKFADVVRDRYGNPFIQVEIDEATAPAGSDHGAVVPRTGAEEAPFLDGGEAASATEKSPGRPGGHPS